MSRRPRQTAAFSLFTFLDVMLCTLGALIIVLICVVRTAQIKNSDIAPEDVAAVEEIDAQRETTEWRTKHLTASREQLRKQLQDRRLELSHIEEHTRRLRAQLAEADAAEKVLAADHQHNEKLDQLASEAQKLAGQVAEAERDLQRTREEALSKRPSYAVVPYEGPNQTTRRPMYIECRADRVILQPENIELTVEDFMGPLGPGNPLAAGLRAAQEYLSSYQNVGDDGEPYPLLLVRPDGVETYYIAREAVSSWGAEFGYEFIDQDWKLEYREPQPAMVDAMRLAIMEARLRQRALARAAPRYHGARGQKWYHASSQGGVVPEGGVHADDDDAPSSTGGRYARGRGAGRGGGGNFANGGDASGGAYARGAGAGRGGPAFAGRKGTGGGSDSSEGGLSDDDNPYLAAAQTSGRGGGTGLAGGAGPPGAFPGGGAAPAGTAGPSGAGPGGAYPAGGAGAVAGGLDYGTSTAPGLAGASAAGAATGGPGGDGNGSGMNSIPGGGANENGPLLTANSGGGQGTVSDLNPLANSGGNGNAPNGMPGSNAGGGGQGDGTNPGANGGFTGNTYGSGGLTSLNGAAQVGGGPAGGGRFGTAPGAAAGGTGDGQSGTYAQGGTADQNGSTAGKGAAPTGSRGAGRQGTAPGIAQTAAQGAEGPGQAGGKPGQTGAGQTGKQLGGQYAAGGGQDASATGSAAGSSASMGGGSPGASGGTPNMNISMGSPAGMTSSSPGGTASSSMAGSRGKNWSLPEEARRAVPITRPVRVECQPDRLVLRSEQNPKQTTEIPLKDRTEDSIDDLVSSVWKNVDTWGQAGRGMYWHPVLSVDVAPGADGRYHDLQTLLADSGLEVKPAPKAPVQAAKPKSKLLPWQTR